MGRLPVAEWVDVVAAGEQHAVEPLIQGAECTGVGERWQEYRQAAGLEHSLDVALAMATTGGLHAFVCTSAPLMPIRGGFANASMGASLSYVVALRVAGSSHCGSGAMVS